MTFGIIMIAVMLVLSVSVAFSFGLGAILAVWGTSVKPAMATSVLFQCVDSFPLMAIPFFIVAGDLMNNGGISRRLIDFTDSIIGKVKANLCYVMVLGCVFFGAISGSSVATVAAIGGLLLPRMALRGYNMNVCAALITCSGFLGILIPPSIALILYGVVAGESIAALFLSTVIPGIILALIYVAVTYFHFVRKGYFDGAEYDQKVYTVQEKARQIWKTSVVGFPALFMPVLILGGIYGGIFTPTEAACVAVVYSTVVGFLVYRELKWNTIGGLLKKSLITVTVLMFMVAFVYILGRIMVLEQLPQQLAVSIMSLTTNKYLILLFLNLFLLVVGMLMDTNVAILLLTPILLPLLKGIGVDPIHFGSILTMNLGIGLITPPFAANLFVATRVSGIPIADILPHLWVYFLAACLPVLAMTIYIPELSTWLPKFILG